MENLIYILIPVVLFLIKAYQNFVKEQQKAANRNNRPQPPQPVLSEPLIDKQTEAVELKPENELSKEEKRIKKKQELAFEDKKKFPRDYYNPEIPSAEVIENRLLHEKHHHDYKFPQLEEEPATEFDLRDAVIKEAILRRPYSEY